MRRSISMFTMLGALLLLGAPTVQAQSSALSFDVRGSYAIPFGDFADRVEGDFGFGVGAVVSLSPRFGIYGGWGKDSFRCDNVLCNPDSRLNVAGFEGG